MRGPAYGKHFQLERFTNFYVADGALSSSIENDRAFDLAGGGKPIVYMVNNEHLTLQQHEAKAKAWGGHVTSVADQQELNLIRRLVNNQEWVYCAIYFTSATVFSSPVSRLSSLVSFRDLPCLDLRASPFDVSRSPRLYITSTMSVSGGVLVLSSKHTTSLYCAGLCWEDSAQDLAERTGGGLTGLSGSSQSGTVENQITMAATRPSSSVIVMGTGTISILAGGAGLCTKWEAANQNKQSGNPPLAASLSRTWSTTST